MYWIIWIILGFESAHVRSVALLKGAIEIRNTSLYFPNQRSQYLSVGNAGDFALNGTGFTIEAWVYPKGLGARYNAQTICGTHDTAGNDSGWGIALGDNGTVVNSMGIGLNR